MEEKKYYRYSNEYKNIENDMEENSEKKENLEKLIKMAEESCKRIKMLEDVKESEKMRVIIKISLIYAIIVGSTSLAYPFSDILLNYGITLITAIVTIMSMLVILYWFIQIKKIKNLEKQLKLEKHMLDKALYIIYEYKDYVYSHKSSLSNILLDLRINRLEFILNSRSFK